MSYSHYSQRLVNYSEFHNTLQSKHLKHEDVEVGKEFIFNDFNAGVYQEFTVVKINKYKSKQERVLGIDLYNLYNDLPKNKQNMSKTTLTQICLTSSTPVQRNLSGKSKTSQTADSCLTKLFSLKFTTTGNPNKSSTK